MMPNIPKLYGSMDGINLFNFKGFYESEANHHLPEMLDGVYWGKQSGDRVLFLYAERLFAVRNNHYSIRGCGNVRFTVKNSEFIFD